jgi:hypothetical protein
MLMARVCAEPAITDFFHLLRRDLGLLQFLLGKIGKLVRRRA